MDVQAAAMSKRIPQLNNDDRFQIETGRADNGRSFTRVTDLTTGNSRIQVGFNGESAFRIVRRLAEQLSSSQDESRS